MAIIVYPVDAVTGAPSYTGRSLRETLAPLLAGATAARPLGARSGVRPGTSATTVTATSTTWTVGPHAGILDMETAAEAGPYAYAINAPVVSATVVAAHATLPRVDIVWVRLDDPAESDGSSVPAVVAGYTAGTAASTPAAPAAPARCMVLATINVPLSGGGAPTVIWAAPYTVAAGGVLPVPAGVYPATPYVGQYVDDATLGLLRYNGTAWQTTRPRIGASVNLVDSWSTQATRTHAGTWNVGEDSGGFVGALTGNTTPITIPAGKGGLYAVSLGMSNSVAMTSAGFIQISIGGTLLTGSQSYYRVAMPTSAAQGSIALTLPLAAGCTLTIISSLTATAYSVNATLSCYRIGD